MSGLQAALRQDRAQLGIAMMLGAWLLFSFVDTSVKWLVIAGLPAMQLAFMRYVGHFLISLIDVGRGGFTKNRFRTDHFWLVTFRGLLLVSATCFNFYALKTLSLTLTSAIMFSAPILVCALAVPLLGERVGPWRWFAILLGFAGVMVVIRPFGEGFTWVALLPLYNALALAFYSIITRKLSGIVATSTMQFYMGFQGTLILLPFAIWQWENPTTYLDWAIMFALGVWAWGGHELLTRAHSFASANTLMPFTYSFMIYLTIASYVVFNHIPDGFTVLGAGIIVVSGLIIWARERKETR